MSQDCKAARDAGLTQAQVEAIPHWQISDLFSPAERAVLAYTDELVLSRGRVSDAVFAQLKEYLGDRTPRLCIIFASRASEMHDNAICQSINQTWLLQ